jgi:hypothetical protein
MLPRLTEATYRGDYRVWLRFSDGVEGEVDLEGELWGDVFQSLKDKTLFAELQVSQELETLVWPNGADFAPEYLYQLLRREYELKPTPQSGAA